MQSVRVIIPALLMEKKRMEELHSCGKLPFMFILLLLKTFNAIALWESNANFQAVNHLFILSVYMPSSNHALDEYREYLDFLWALYDSLSADSFVLVMGDLNGDLGNSLGDKGLKEPNERGKLLLDFANYFNLCPINLLVICDCPLETYFSHCGKYRSTIDYKFLPYCLQNSIVMSKTFDLDIDNSSDHQPVIAKLDYSIPDELHGQHCPNSTTKQKIHWSNISQETVNVRYVDPLLSDISKLNIPSSRPISSCINLT